MLRITNYPVTIKDILGVILTSTSQRAWGGELGVGKHYPFGNYAPLLAH